MLRVIKSSLPVISLDSLEEKIFSFLKEASQSHSVQLRCAGGWIRDKILGKQSKDLDITVEGMTGIEFANLIKKYAINKFGANQNVVGSVKDTEARPEQVKNLSVAFTKIYGQEVELLTLRGNEVYESGNRNPVSVNMNASVKDDAFRRDLTINSLFYNINNGQVEDYTGKGLSDIQTMTLRTPLEPLKTFKDDPLRLLRVLRFYSRYPQSNIAPEVVEAMKDSDVQNQIVRKILNNNDQFGIVPERTAIELRKIMSGEQPDKSVRLMYETGLLSKMLNLPPEFHPLNMDQQNKHHKLSVIDHTLAVLRNVNNLCKEYALGEDDRLRMNLASLFHDLGKLDPRSHTPKRDGSRGYSGNPDHSSPLNHQQSSGEVWNNFAFALKLSDEDRKFVHDIVINHMNPHAHIQPDGESSDKQLRKYLRKNPTWFFQYIHAMADAMSKDNEDNLSAAEDYRTNINKLRQLSPNMNETGQIAQAKDLLNGQEIIQIVKANPKPPQGERFGYIEVVKERLREEQDSNPMLTKDQAVQIVHNMVSGGELIKFLGTDNWLKKSIDNSI